MTSKKETTGTVKEVLRKFESLYRYGDRNSAEYAEILETIGKILASSVVKKCLDPRAKTGDNGNGCGCNPMLMRVRIDIQRDYARIKSLIDLESQAWATRYNADGDIERYVADKGAKYAADLLARERLGDGIDLAQEAIVELLDQIKNMDVSGKFTEQKKQERRLKSRVRIKSDDNVDGWETIDKSPIQKSYGAVRNLIDGDRALTINPKNMHAYLDDVLTDPQTGAEKRVYRRLPKCYDLGGHVVDNNGAETFYTVDNQAVDDIDALIDKLQLTDRQAVVLRYRMQGHGYKSIATYLGVSFQAVAKICGLIQKKAYASGIATADKAARWAAEKAPEKPAPEKPAPEKPAKITVPDGYTRIGDRQGHKTVAHSYKNIKMWAD